MPRVSSRHQQRTVAAMPLVLFVGLPASGKTTRAKQLLSHLQQYLFP